MPSRWWIPHRARTSPCPTSPPSNTMIIALVPLLATLQLPPQQPPADAPASPIARIVVTPATPVVQARDTIRLSAQALDAQGRPVPDATIRFVAAGGSFEGRVDADGLVRSGSTGTI